MSTNMKIHIARIIELEEIKSLIISLYKIVEIIWPDTINFYNFQAIFAHYDI